MSTSELSSRGTRLKDRTVPFGSQPQTLSHGWISCVHSMKLHGAAAGRATGSGSVVSPADAVPKESKSVKKLRRMRRRRDFVRMPAALFVSLRCESSPMENLIPYEGYFRVKTPLMFRMRETRRWRDLPPGAFRRTGSGPRCCAGDIESRKRPDGFPSHCLDLGWVVGAADHPQRRTYRKFKPPFFSGELYRRTRELSISFLFDENPVVTSVDSVDTPVGGVRSIPFGRVGLRRQAFSAAQVVWNKSNHCGGARVGQTEMAEDFDKCRRNFDGGDDLQGSTAVRPVIDVDVEDPFEQPGPTHARRRALRVRAIASGLGCLL